MTVSDASRPRPRRGAAFRLQPLDRRLEIRSIATVGTWVEKPVSLNTTSPMRTDGGCGGDELERGRLGGLHAGRRDIGRRHAARDVEGQQHRALQPRHADDALRSGERQDQDRDAGQGQDRRQPPEPGVPGRTATSGRCGHPGRRPPLQSLRPRRPLPAPPELRRAGVARRRSRTRYTQTHSGIVRRKSSSGGQMKDIAAATPWSASGERRAGRSPRAGRRRSRGSRRRTPARWNAARRSASRCSAAAR